MGKEDYLKRQISQLGFVLKKILEKLTGTKIISVILSLG